MDIDEIMYQLSFCLNMSKEQVTKEIEQLPCGYGYALEFVKCFARLPTAQECILVPLGYIGQYHNLTK